MQRTVVRATAPIVCCQPCISALYLCRTIRRVSACISMYHTHPQFPPGARRYLSPSTVAAVFDGDPASVSWGAQKECEEQRVRRERKVNTVCWKVAAVVLGVLGWREEVNGSGNVG